MKSSPCLVLLFSAATALFTACTTGPTIKTDADSVANFSGYKSFAMARPTELTSANTSDVSLQLMRQVREVTQNGFAAKGLTPTTREEADLIVFVHGGTQEKLDIENYGPAIGRFGRAYVGASAIDQHKEGTVRIDVFDAHTKEIVWRGSAAAEVGDKLEPAKVTAAVAAVIARYPN